MAQGIFEEYPDRKGKPVQRAHTLALQLTGAEDHRLAAGQRELGPGAEGIQPGGHGRSGSVESTFIWLGP